MAAARREPYNNKNFREKKAYSPRSIDEQHHVYAVSPIVLYVGIGDGRTPGQDL
jgi:hypothetical protein